MRQAPLPTPGSSLDVPALHYWIVAGTTNRRKPINSKGDGIVCAICGIAYYDAPAMDGCPGRTS